MNGLLITVAIFLVFIGGAASDLCAAGAKQIDGNWYCQPVEAIRYSNVGHNGVYRKVVGMHSDGTCSSTASPFSGPLSPFDEEVSLHFRGPLHLKQFAAYTPSPSTKTKRDGSTTNVHRHGHWHAHKERSNVNHCQKRQEAYATIDGQLVSWENNWFGPSATATPDSGNTTPQMVTATIDGVAVSWINNWFGGSAATPLTPSAAAPAVQTPMAQNIGQDPALTTPELLGVSDKLDTAVKPSTVHGGSGTYERIGYYNSVNQTLDNLVFLGNHGGQGSGVFDYLFGASLAYSNSDATGGASSPQVLSDKAIASDTEFTILLGQECKNDCGFVRPGSVAYHGFDGADKIFLIDFSMPMDGTSGFNADMPAIWMLNAQIPRVLQYGNSACSCWESGCGEFDIAEALHSGSTFLKSTLHAIERGGDSDYFLRPSSGTMKLAVVFSSATSTIHLQVLPGKTQFSATLSTHEIDALCSKTGTNRISLFSVS